MKGELNQTPTGARPKLVIAGRRNAGKSSFINALTNQNTAIVSETPGTTADPVIKAMEILPVGPVTIIDTAGIDDKGKLGKLRVEKALMYLKQADFVFLIVSAQKGFSSYEKEIILKLQKQKKQFALIINKIDLKKDIVIPSYAFASNIFYVSSKTKRGVKAVKDKLSSVFIQKEKFIVKDLIEKGDTLVLVVPIDSAAPKGRLILPQVQTIREALDASAVCVTVKETELKKALLNLKKPPALVATDSQAIEYVMKIVPKRVPLTTFSILFARYKGDLKELIKGIDALKKLKDGDNIMILEACTHHPMPDDIGRKKLPRWLKDFTKKKIKFSFFSGTNLPEKLPPKTKLAVHCGGCMLTETQMKARISILKEKNIPVVNYGVVISFVHGAINRVLKPFKEKGGKNE